MEAILSIRCSVEDRQLTQEIEAKAASHVSPSREQLLSTGLI